MIQYNIDISNKDSEVYKYVYDSEQGISVENYNAICWLINNFYISQN